MTPEEIEEMYQRATDWFVDMLITRRCPNCGSFLTHYIENDCYACSDCNHNFRIEMTENKERI